MHEVKSIITFEFSDNYSGIQQNSTLQHGKCSKTQNARGAREIAFAAIFNLTTHLLDASLKRKTDNIPCGVLLQQREQEPLVCYSNTY